jgi:hypothetical protein
MQFKAGKRIGPPAREVLQVRAQRATRGPDAASTAEIIADTDGHASWPAPCHP